MDAIKDLYIIAFNFALKFLSIMENCSLIMVMILYLLKFTYTNFSTEIFECYFLQEILNKCMTIVQETVINHIQVGAPNGEMWMMWIL
jgi:hypothetical protein